MLSPSETFLCRGNYFRLAPPRRVPRFSAEILASLAGYTGQRMAPPRVETLTIQELKEARARVSLPLRRANIPESEVPRPSMKAASQFEPSGPRAAARIYPPRLRGEQSSPPDEMSPAASEEPARSSQLIEPRSYFPRYSSQAGGNRGFLRQTDPRQRQHLPDGVLGSPEFRSHQEAQQHASISAAQP
jgi:hypothetical protein